MSCHPWQRTIQKKTQMEFTSWPSMPSTNFNNCPLDSPQSGTWKPNSDARMSQMGGLALKKQPPKMQHTHMTPTNKPRLYNAANWAIFTGQGTHVSVTNWPHQTISFQPWFLVVPYGYEHILQMWDCHFKAPCKCKNYYCDKKKKPTSVMFGYLIKLQYDWDTAFAAEAVQQCACSHGIGWNPRRMEC